jgi:thiamine pyrophosphokinase
MKAVLVCGGEMPDPGIIGRYREGPKALLIGVDSGASHILRAGLLPDVVFGDLDSIDSGDLRAIESRGVRIHRFPPEKDFTDTAAAVRHAVEVGCREIVLLAAVGRRVDHMTANILSMRVLAEAGIRVIVADDHNELTAITDRYARERADLPFPSAFVSLIPLTDEVTGITTRGLKYPLVNGTLSMRDPSHGISNEVVDDRFEIDVAGGVLMVAVSRD